MTRRFAILLPDGSRREFRQHGRCAWALSELVKAGTQGCTAIDHPGPRWSAYVHKLRRAGLTIETIHERHGGPYPGCHARYVLQSRIVPLDGQEGGQ